MENRITWNLSDIGKFFMYYLLCIVCMTNCGEKEVQAQTKIVLKLDDIGARKNQCKALPVMEYLLHRNIKASYGIIANRLDETALPLLSKVIQATDAEGKPMTEIWHHGLDHSRNENVFEFKNRSYQEQKLHFDSAHNLVKKYLGVNMNTFGAPFNATDSICLRVIAEHGGYRKIFFSKVSIPTGSALQQLNNSVPMEKEVGKPDFEYFKEQYSKYARYAGSNMVLQGHPTYWTAEGLEQFKKILDFLDGRNCIYVLPSQL
jgi:hypothetical protein